LEIVGERWTLLIIRDAFYGVRRFNDFRDHLDIPRAVLTARLNLLVEHDVLARSAATSGRDEYVLTDKGQRLWPTLWSLISWGNEFYLPPGRQRPFTHLGCGGSIRADGGCETCEARPDPHAVVMHPRPASNRSTKTDPASRALSSSRRLLEPLDGHPVTN
jgi:DNA-binding HxlR family transcriptional regulator